MSETTSTVSPDAAPTGVGPSRASSAASRVVGAIEFVTLLRIEVLLLTVFPASLVLPLGSFGAPARLFELVLFACWLCSVALPGQNGIRRCRPVRIVLVIYWLAVVLSAFVMYFHPMPGDELAGTSRYLVNLLCTTGLALAAAEGLRRREDVKTIVRTAVYGFSFMAFVGILQGRAGIDLVTYISKVPGLSPDSTMGGIDQRGGFARPPGTALHPIEFGVLTAAFLGLAIWAALYDETERSRFLRWGPVALLGFAVPVSISRSALLVTITVLIMFFVGADRTLRLKGLATVAAAGAFIFVSVPGLLGTLAEFVTIGSSDSSISTRTSDYAATAPFLRHSPWVGRGPGTFFPPNHTLLDNQYLSVLIEMGIIGLAATLIFLLAPAFLARGARHRSTSTGDRFLGQMLAAASIGMTLASATFDSLWFPTFARTAGLLLGLSGAWWMTTREELEGYSELPAANAIRSERA